MPLSKPRAPASTGLDSPWSRTKFRKLAERSNKAAGEIVKLIKESGERVEEGARLSEERGVTEGNSSQRRGYG